MTCILRALRKDENYALAPLHTYVCICIYIESQFL